MANPFITEPSSLVTVQENFTVTLVWEIRDCDWEVRIVTEKYTVHPNIDPTRVPIKIHTDYNASITPEVCKENTMNTSVTLTIKLTESILEHVKYIICKIFRYDDESWYRSRVNFELATTGPPRAETTDTTMTVMPITSHTTTKSDDNINTVNRKMETTVNSGSNLSIHFINCYTVLLCTIYLSFVFLLHV